MSYLVLARKWRPRSFDTLVGQDHVVRALTHALTTQRLHHAWLFTGTRGVGKTTLSRILAKSLNCEQGITATPCGHCRACTEIDAGRYIDYVELDAASNRGVDEMTQLLEQAVYAPGAGRFKVYMIDEVHMLTGHAFNAMLKTLEEPPPHVKFILATTDPQKIPVTVLSRCLQFNLKQMTAAAIVGHLQQVLGEESIPFELPALRLLAQSAAGSMRDALSLTDQAIAYSGGDLTAESVQGMLGAVDRHHLVALLQALSVGDGAAVVAVADDLAARGLSYAGALADLAVLLSRVAIAQRVPHAVADDDPEAASLADLAAQLHPDQIQLYYAVAVHSRQELSLAPDPYAGFVMACLRMLALAPADDIAAAGPAGAPPVARPAMVMTASAASASAPVEAAPVEAAPAKATSVEAAPVQAPPVDVASMGSPERSEPPAPAVPEEGRSVDTTPAVDAPMEASPPADAPSTTVSPSQPEPKPEPLSPSTAPAVSADVPPWEDAAAEPPAVEDASPVQPAPADTAAGEPVADCAVLSADAVTRAADADASSASADEEAPPWSDPDLDTGADDDDTVSLTGEDAGWERLDGDLPAGAGLALPPAAVASPSPRALSALNAQEWPAVAAALPLAGAAQQLARQSEWLGVDGPGRLSLRVGVTSLAGSQARRRLETVLTEHFGQIVTVDIEIGRTGDDTAHAHEQAERAQRQAQAESQATHDPLLVALLRTFDATIVPGSIVPAAGPA